MKWFWLCSAGVEDIQGVCIICNACATSDISPGSVERNSAVLGNSLSLQMSMKDTIPNNELDMVEIGFVGPRYAEFPAH